MKTIKKYLSRGGKCFLFAAIAACGLMGCSKHSSESKSIAEESEIKTLGATNLSDLVSDFKIVPLETSDSIIIGRISSIKKRGDALFLVSDNRLLKFSLSGNFVGELIHKGPGPDEVMDIADYEARGNDAYILAPGKLIVKNHITGEKIKEMPMPDYVSWGRLRDTDSGLLVIAQHPEEGQNSILLIDVDAGEVKSEFFPASKNWGLSNGMELVELGDGKYIHQYGQSADLAVITPTTQSVDSIQLVNSSDAIGADEYSERSKQLHSSNDLGLTTYHGLTATGSNLFWMGIGADGMTLYLNDKNTKSTIAVPGNELKDDLSWADNIMENMMIGVLAFNESDDNAFISHLDPAMLKDAVEGKSLKFEEAYEVLDKVGEDANPLIVFLEFKPIKN